MKVVRLLGVLVAVAVAAVLVWWLAPKAGDGAAGGGGGAPGGTGGGGAKPPPLSFAIVPALCDRFVPEPCNRIPGGGLLSLRAFVDVAIEPYPATMAIAMGDLTLAPGDIGRATAALHYYEVFGHTRVATVSVGEGELGLGTRFLRDELTRNEGIKFLCANALDAGGNTVLNGWSLTDAAGRHVVLVGVAGDSLAAELAQRGSDVRLAPARECAAKAREDAFEQATRIGRAVEVSVLLVHGTIEETQAIVRAVPGWTFAVAAHGPVLPENRPRRVDGTPVLYGGQGARYGLRALVRDERREPDFTLDCIGELLLQRESPYEPSIRFLREQTTENVWPEVLAREGSRPRDPRGDYAGSARCAECHGDQAVRHAASPHARPWPEIAPEHFAGSTQCLPCHVTGAWYADGWKGPKDDSDLASVSCEACHGPGGTHVVMQDAGWGKVGWSRCRECHLPDRSPGFEPAAAWRRVGHSR